MAGRQRYNVTVGDATFVVEVSLDERGAAAVVVDGRERTLDVKPLPDGLAWVDTTGGGHGAVFARLERRGEGYLVGLRGAEIAATVEDARFAGLAAGAARKAAGGGGPAIVRAPMPGRIVKVMVKAGDQVTAGQGVTVVEAMKMENELRAPRAGVVRDVRAQEGSAVEAGQELVVLD